MNYQNPYMMQNPYQPYLQNPYNQNVYNPQIETISGKYVQDFGMISANDVPMNGQGAIFPKNDLSEIEVRKWNADGTISKTLYLPQSLPIVNEVSNSSTENVKSLESAFKCVTEPLEERLARIEELLKPKARTKKEANDES